MDATRWARLPRSADRARFRRCSRVEDEGCRRRATPIPYADDAVRDQPRQHMPAFVVPTDVDVHIPKTRDQELPATIDNRCAGVGARVPRRGRPTQTARCGRPRRSHPARAKGRFCISRGVKRTPHRSVVPATRTCRAPERKHSRDTFGPSPSPSPGLTSTRRTRHMCAPSDVFLRRNAVGGRSA
jgi:hypothetical protein